MVDNHQGVANYSLDRVDARGKLLTGFNRKREKSPFVRHVCGCHRQEHKNREKHTFIPLYTREN